MVRQYFLCGDVIKPALILLHKLRDPDLSCPLMSADIRKPAVHTFKIPDAGIQRRVKACIISVPCPVDLIEF